MDEMPNSKSPETLDDPENHTEDDRYPETVQQTEELPHSADPAAAKSSNQKTASHPAAAAASIDPYNK